MWEEGRKSPPRPRGHPKPHAHSKLCALDFLEQFHFFLLSNKCSEFLFKIKMVYF